MGVLLGELLSDLCNNFNLELRWVSVSQTAFFPEFPLRFDLISISIFP